MNKPKIAIIIAFNDLETFHGGSLNGIKSSINYFDQFLMLYESIQTNWKQTHFNYKIIALHSVNFTDRKAQILKKLDVEVIKVTYDLHPVKIRPMAYKIDMECDYRLVLDTDMIALSEPKFDFSYDAMGMYGGNKYNFFQWRKICKLLECKMPLIKTRLKEKGAYNYWRFQEHYNYQSGSVSKRQFPFFNNGAILLKDSLSNEFALIWEDYRLKYTNYVRAEFDKNMQIVGQDVVGLAMHNVTKNWTHFPRGFNFILQERFELGVKLMDEYKELPSLIHYIHVSEKNKYFSIVKELHEKVVATYY